jgi:hypothetical protein
MLPSVRRWSLGVALSLAGHAVVVGGVAAVLMLRGLSLGRPVDVDVVGMRLDEVHDLPLGAPAAGEAEPQPARHRPRARHRTPKPPAPADGELGDGDARDAEERAGARADEDQEPAPAPPKNLRELGPEGSRVTVLLRLDRLRGTPYAPGLDAILARLPDRRDLLDGTGLDLYDSFDALLIATPNPLDPAVTFLAARHRLGDAALREALERGARATGRILSWRTERRRPVAERRARDPQPGAVRDDRLLLMPAPGLVVVTPPVYRSMLLGSPKPRAAAAPDGGTAAGDGGAPAVLGAGAGAGKEGWGALLRRIDAEDGIMPPDGVAMLSAVDIFSARGLARGLDSVPGARARPGAADGATPRGQATILGLEVPKVMTVVIGVDPAPFVNVTAEFNLEADAVHWEREWPGLQRQLGMNPYFVFSGFSGVIRRTEVTRDGSSIHLHQSLTEGEALRILQVIPRFMGAN